MVLKVVDDAQVYFAHSRSMSIYTDVLYIRVLPETLIIDEKLRKAGDSRRDAKSRQIPVQMLQQVVHSTAQISDITPI